MMSSPSPVRRPSLLPVLLPLTLLVLGLLLYPHLGAHFGTEFGPHLSLQAAELEGVGLISSLGSLSLGAQAATVDLAAVREYRKRHAAKILRDFSALLEIPNVASDGPNIRRNAEVLVEKLAARDIDARLLTLPDTPEAPPIVYGRLDVPGATRTLGLYLHYDGQPVDPEEWTWDPWTPILTTASLEDGGVQRPLPEIGEEVDPEWRIYARSAGDDKDPVPALLTALDALKEQGKSPTSNLVFFFEGEEEVGSPHLDRYLEKYRELVSVDGWLIFDGPVHPSGRPVLVFGVRGYSGLELTVYGADRYLHSGHYGNWAPNPGQRLARLLASLKDDQGQVLVEGFYDSTAPITEADRAGLATLPDYDSDLRRELGLAPGATEGQGVSLAERLMIPSLNLRGLESAEVGDRARNVIPTEAVASIDIRLAQGNDPNAMLDLVEAHIAGQGYHIVREDPDEATRLAHPLVVKSRRQPGYPAQRTSMDLPLVRQVIAATRQAANGHPLGAGGEGEGKAQDLILQPTYGGSLPLYLFADNPDLPVVIVPIANHDNNQHAPDENMRMANLFYGIDLMAALLTLSP
ncbi:MAG: M20/M25/M40 family metallo-hydrolase [Acidobacteriota bacterium]